MINAQIASEVKRVLDKNKAERHIRGGKATCLKYKNTKKNVGEGKEMQALL